MNRRFSIGIIGSGKVASQLSRVFQKKGHKITFIYSRNQESAAQLAESIGAGVLSKIEDINHLPLDFIVIAINDDQIENITKEIPVLNNPDTIFMHTSGTVSSEIFKGKFKKFGVFYPLQTFSGKGKMKFKKIPICIQANTKASINKMESLARSISRNVYRINDKDRFVLHIAAVIASNFSNYMYSLSDDLLREHQLPFELLKPLIKETAQKVMHGEPEAVQTGPARRGDRKTLKKHLAYLKDKSALQKLYAMLSESISKKYN